ncbi:MAG: dihydrofolate reductase family protein [Candidatus Krumholzibacteriota bacterium]|nr:dihydrofolate reductase family protein [Candidatus Krumholzibacteriota bacterium]
MTIPFEIDRTHVRRHGRPFVTLSYAQSLDGSVSERYGEKSVLSCETSMRLTHALRADHDAILIGIGTVLADDPRLTVRHAFGRSPRPVIFDSHLRFPITSRLLVDNPFPPVIVCTEEADRSRGARLEKAGADVVRVAADPAGRVDIPAALVGLAGRGIGSLMVEGGSRIITSFLCGGHVDRVVLTVAPVFLGGMPSVGGVEAASSNRLPRLEAVSWMLLGRDLVVTGVPERDGGKD